MDLDDTESIDFNALGGADTIVVNDLAGTDVTEINLNLAAAGGAGDGAADTIVINATDGDDVVFVFGDSGNVSVAGLVPPSTSPASRRPTTASSSTGCRDDAIVATDPGRQHPAHRRRRRGQHILIGGEATTRCWAGRATTSCWRRWRRRPTAARRERRHSKPYRTLDPFIMQRRRPRDSGCFHRVKSNLMAGLGPIMPSVTANDLMDLCWQQATTPVPQPCAFLACVVYSASTAQLGSKF
jgi:hypothetical protein